MVKATQATQSQDSGTEKSQNHHPHTANGDKNDSEHVMIDAFRWSRCKKPLPQKAMRAIGIPLPLEHVEVFSDHSSLSFDLYVDNVLDSFPSPFLCNLHIHWMSAFYPTSILFSVLIKE